MHPREQTIFALSSGRLPSAIAVVRVSGPQAGAVLEGLAGRGHRPASRPGRCCGMRAAIRSTTPW